MRNLLWSALIATVLPTPLLATGLPLSNTALLQRCYMQLTQSTLLATDPLVTAVKNGRDPIDACIEDVFRAALLVQESGNYAIPTATRDLGKKVFNNFHLLHSSWFHFRRPASSVVTFGSINIRMYAIYEMNGAANYLTRSLFDQSVDANYFLTTLDYLRTMRDEGPTTDSFYLSASEDAALSNYLGTGVNVMYDKGTAFGMKLLTDSERTFATPVIPPATSGQDNYPRGAMPGVPTTSFKLFQNYGGGILGLDYYIARTYDETNVIRNNGAVEVPRKWSENIYRDLLCLDLPVVRESDAAAFVEPESDAPFRQASGCTTCHVSTDRMAGLIKSIALVERRTQAVWTPYIDTTKWNKGTDGDFTWSSNNRTTFTSSGGVFSNYIREDHKGNLYYRDYRGNLIDVRVDSIAKLGDVLSQQMQPYVCAAKRYYQYFTGIDVDVSDPGESPLPLSPADQAQFDFVINLAKLAYDQSRSPQFGKMSAIVEQILRSPQYKKSDFGAQP